MTTIDDVKKALGEFADMLVFEDIGKYIVAKPRQFLGSENFAKIASIFRKLGGEYISAGKESHFRVLKGEAVPVSHAVEGSASKEADVCPHCGKIIVILDSIKYEISHRVVKE